MKIHITITQTIETDSVWFTADDAAVRTDDEIVALLQEDIPAVLDGAAWEIRREQETAT